MLWGDTMSFFTRRHFIWLVQMCHDLQLSDDQITHLKKLLTTTNSRFDEDMFDKAILKAWMQN